MLWNPKWEKKIAAKTKADPFSLHTLIAWLEQQDLAAAYQYLNIDDCPLARYFRAHGYRGAFCGTSGFTYFGPWYLLGCLKRAKFPASFDDAVADLPRTYGAALERARATL